MLNPKMNSWGLYELYRQQAEQLRAENDQDRPTTEPAKTNWAPGSMEWQAEQNKSE
jgi:hypothetical protein